MKTYQAEVSRDGRFWLVRVPTIGRSTQARHLRELEAMTEDVISIMTGEAPGRFRVEYRIEVPESVRMHLDEARRLHQREAHARAQAAAEARAAAQELRDQGLPVRDIGRVLGVSFQRAHRLLATPR